ncbi:hypothetical protein [Nostoc sp. 'Peltigera membranacea cyanobiont' 232]|uniref:hypothetical protein n=1 Tax=Nostoc sp. 'Peltigera membranacea cyanobiont' 232 TaxID=2014531 RepID=UPI000B95443D|nr:hypothetical protein [Nostoc sp. 'Peltigera membranacea cyanobiont' 232]OYE02718.1 hypothetical protein CDG79_22305 [Nostoc sp. 'Peltigera membranacea cyanobiont' 232]
MKPKQVISSLLTSATLGQSLNLAAFATAPVLTDSHSTADATLVANASTPPALQIVAKDGDTIGAKGKVRVGVGGNTNIIDKNGSIVYFVDGDVFRDKTPILAKGQMIEGYKIWEIKGYYLFKNGTLDICAELYNPQTRDQKTIVMRNNAVLFDSKASGLSVTAFNATPAEESYILIAKDANYKDRYLVNSEGALLTAMPNLPHPKPSPYLRILPGEPQEEEVKRVFPELGLAGGRNYVREVQKSQSGAEAILVTAGLGIGQGFKGTAIIKRGGKAVENQAPKQKPQKIYDIFVGGLLDESGGQAVEDVTNRIKIDNSYKNITVKYATHTDYSKIKNYIAEAKSNGASEINVIAHSWGSNQATNAVIDSKIPVTNLVLVDPVADLPTADAPTGGRDRDKPKQETWEERVKKRLAAVRKNVTGLVVDINATGDSKKLSDGNGYASIGGKWGTIAKSVPGVILIESPTQHAYFPEMIGEKDNDNNAVTNASARVNGRTIFDIITNGSYNHSKNR